MSDNPPAKKEKVKRTGGNIVILDDDPCKACGNLMSAVQGGRVVINNLSWHRTCYKCKSCGGQLPNDKVLQHPDTQDVLCRDCWTKQCSGQCAKCGKSFQPSATVLRAFNASFHRECFVCHKCNESIAEDEFVDIAGKPHHERCSMHAGK